MKKIIHVDNSEFFRKLVRIFLEREGFEVDSYGSAQEANFVIASGSADMVITGLAFADSEGEEFLRRTIESFAGPIIVVSASMDQEKEEKLLAMGVHAVISKSGSWQDHFLPHLRALK